MGSSKDRRRSGQRRAEKVKNRRRRLAEEETNRERHAKLINERTGDPRYLQKETWPGGRTLSWDPESRAGAELGETLEHQIARFRAKFGRDPQGDEPIFFDPDADVPTPMRVEDFHATLEALIENADEIGIDPALLRAWRALGYLVTEENRHLFSAAEVQAWTDAVERYREDHDEADEPDAADLIEMLADELQAS